jgi:competence protein ComFC
MCERPGPAPCAGCLTTLRPAPSLAVPAGLVACRALLAYDGPGRDLVARLKYRNARSALPWLASGMAALTVAAGDEVDVVTWAPTTGQRRRERGFDQAELLARRVARELGRPAVALLRREPGPHQTGLRLAERRAGPRFRPRRAAARAAPRHHVLLVDDVVTSGATLTRAARVLTGAGAATVVGLAAARTAPPRARGA